MKTTTFTNRGAFYDCSEPGDQSGEYVKADVVRGLVEALSGLLGTIDTWEGEMTIEAHWERGWKEFAIAESAARKALEAVK